MVPPLIALHLPGPALLGVVAQRRPSASPDPSCSGMVMQLVGALGGIEALRPLPAHHPVRGLARPARSAPVHRTAPRGRASPAPSGAWSAWPPPSSSCATRHHRRLTHAPLHHQPRRRTRGRPRRRRSRHRRRRWRQQRHPRPARALAPVVVRATSTPTQATLLGHPGVTPASLHATAMCDKGGAGRGRRRARQRLELPGELDRPGQPDAARGLRQVRAERAQQRLLHRGGPEQAGRLPDPHRHRRRRGRPTRSPSSTAASTRTATTPRPASSSRRCSASRPPRCGPTPGPRVAPGHLRHRQRRMPRLRHRDGRRHRRSAPSRSTSTRSRPAPSPSPRRCPRARPRSSSPSPSPRASARPSR